MVVAEFFCAPTRFQRLWCAMIGFYPPTCGVLRGGPLMHKHGDPFEIACAFSAPNHADAELKAFPARPVVPSDIKDAARTLAAHGLVAWLSRRDSDGAVRKQWRSTMHKDIPAWDASLVGHKIDQKDPRLAQGMAAIASNLMTVTVHHVEKVHDKKVRVTLDLDDVS